MLIALVLFVTFALGLYYYFSKGTNPENYWKSFNIPFVDTEALGFSQFSQHSVFQRYDIEIAKYREMKTRGNKEFSGVFENGLPLLYVYGTDLMEQIFVKDFMSCVNRRVNSTELSDPIGRKAIFHAKNQDWKDIRSAINPLFTTGKIRTMCPTIYTSGQQLIKLIENASEDKKPLEIRPLLYRFTSDVAVQILYGTESGAYAEPPGGFFQFAGKLHPQFSAWQLWKWRQILKYPWVAHFLSVPAFNPKAVDHFCRVLRQCRTNLERGLSTNWYTFTGRMAQLANKDKLEQECDIEEKEAGNVNAELEHVNKQFIPTEAHMIGSALSIFTAQSANMLEAFACMIYELAMNPMIQERLYREIQILENNETRVKTETLLKLEYLDKVVFELFRKYSVMLLERRTNADVKLAKYNVTIPKNTQIVVPIHAIHHDEEIYPNPQKFDPERFSPENIKKRHPYAYLPFGAGPRNCIAYRLAKAELKITMVELLKKFKFSRAPETPENYALGSQLLVYVSSRT